MKKILLIGSTGYVGKKLKIKLKLSKKYILICPTRKQGFDIKKKQILKKYLSQGVDYVVNLSGQQHVKKREMTEVIYNGNKNILEISNKLKKKITLIYISTSLVYGYSKKYLKENSKKNPSNCYGKIKYKIEKKYMKTNQNYLILRLCNIYGGKMKSGIIDLIVQSLKYRKNFYFDNEKTFKNFIYIDDVVNIIETLISKNFKNKIFNIGNQNISFMNLLKIFKKFSNNQIIFYNKNISLKKTQSQKIDSKLIKNIMKNYKFKSIQTYLRDEIKS